VFFASIPNELEDTVTIDGCPTFGILWKIIRPASSGCVSIRKMKISQAMP
jgi:ABC-type glycerol-3-phosphate transport system permease component